MAEPRPYAFDSPLLEREALRLIQILRASPSLHAVRTFGPTTIERRGLAYLLGQEEPEASRILITLAVVVRNGIEATGLLPGEDAISSTCLTAMEKFEGSPPARMPEELARLWPIFETAGAVREELGVRETCNKLLHSLRVEWDREDGALTGLSYLFGERPARRAHHTWICRVPVEQFCLNTLHLY